ncbi:MAG: serine--tRNA ligase [Firmicutes bacterium]|nr:serine--tRNA ligase [Bacillota bacterium]
MIALEILREKEGQKKVETMLKKRGKNYNLKDFIKTDEDYRQSSKKLDELLERRNILSKEITPEAKERARKIKQDITDLKDIVKNQLRRRDDMWSFIPNFLDDRVPEGKSDKDNVVVKTYGTPKKFDFEPKWHDDLCIALDILDIKAGTKVSGSGFYYWKGMGAKLVDAVLRFAMDTLLKRNFTQFYTPILTKPSTLFGTGFLPFAEDQIFNVGTDNLALIGTSEQTLIAYHQDEVLDLKDKPKLYTALTPCFRTEAGSYGRDTKGIFRVHQFYKVEQIVICEPQDSDRLLNYCQESIEQILEALEIPYRTMILCGGDTGNASSMTYDTEAWFVGYNTYREVGSASNILEYQSRRLNIKCKNENGKPYYAHTISSTAAVERTVISLIEYYQTKDGGIEIPRVLVPYMGGITKITK